MMTRQMKWLYGILLGMSVIAAGGGIYYYQQQQGPIYEFNDQRDTQDITDLMKQNWYWLINSNDYQVDFMLKRRAPTHKNPRYFGALQIKVLRKEGQFIGFVTYYKKSAYEGTVLFLAVKSEFRGKRYAQLLLDYAVNDLKKRGADYVTLVTRPNNVNAQAVYVRDGFTEVGRDDTYVYYEKQLQ